MSRKGFCVATASKGVRWLEQGRPASKALLVLVKNLSYPKLSKHAPQQTFHIQAVAIGLDFGRTWHLNSYPGRLWSTFTADVHLKNAKTRNSEEPTDLRVPMGTSKARPRDNQTAKHWESSTTGQCETSPLTSVGANSEKGMAKKDKND